MDVTFGNFGKVEVSWKIGITSTGTGLALYYCEWFELISPGFSGFCLWSRIGFSLYFIILLLMSGIIGYIGFKEPLMYWFLFIVPSWIVRLILINESRSNIYPIWMAFDFILFVMLTGIVLGIVALFRRRYISKISRLRS